MIEEKDIERIDLLSFILEHGVSVVRVCGEMGISSAYFYQLLARKNKTDFCQRVKDTVLRMTEE